MSNPGRLKLLLQNYVDARLSGVNCGYDIRQVDPDNFEEYYVMIRPKTGIYMGQAYIMEFKTTYGKGADKYQYPQNPPNAHFITDVFHVNVSPQGGSICVDIFKDKTKWMPTYSFDSTIQSILILFEEPNNLSPYNSSASKLWMECEKEFKASIQGQGKLSVDETEVIRKRCFKNFSDMAASVMRKNNNSKYEQWFPQLSDNPEKYIESEKEELNKFNALVEQLKNIKAKKVDVEDVPDSAPKKNRWEKYQKKGV